MMPPSNQVESNGEGSSSSSRGSVVNSMNLLSTANGGSSISSGDSPNASDMSGKHATSEVSEESDPEVGKEATKHAGQKSGLDLPKEKAPEKVAATRKDERSENAPTKDEFVQVPVAASASVPPANDSDQSVEALALIAVEAAAKHAPAVQAGAQVSSMNAAAAPLHPPAENSTSSHSVQPSRSASSDQSAQYTADSSISGTSLRSNEAPFPPTSGFQTIGAAAAAAVAAAVEPQIPMGQIHLKQRKTSSLSNLHPAPIASIPTAPMMNTTASTGTKSKSSSSLRRGKWTVEEEAYVARVIQDFNSGFLNAPAGTTLRSYLSEKLHCDPMRITKKFTGDACIGKRVFHPAVRCSSNAATIDKAQAELDALERRWRRRLEMQQRESAKKAAASAAAAVAAATGRSHPPGHASSATTGPAAMANPHLHGVPVAHPGSHHVNQTAVARTATWLDRANAILQTKSDVGQHIAPRNFPSAVPSAQGQASSFGSLPQTEIENQMKEVQRLIHEGPIIQQTTSGLPHLLEQGSNLQPKGQRKVTEDQGAVNPSSPAEHADKRARTSSASENSSGAEDAEALVGFLNSVRASAEASGNAFGAP